MGHGVPIEKNYRQRGKSGKERGCVCVAGSRAWNVRLHKSFEAHMILSQDPDTTLGPTGFGVCPAGLFFFFLIS